MCRDVVVCSVRMCCTQIIVHLCDNGFRFLVFLGFGVCFFLYLKLLFFSACRVSVTQQCRSHLMFRCLKFWTVKLSEKKKKMSEVTSKCQVWSFRLKKPNLYNDLLVISSLASVQMFSVVWYSDIMTSNHCELMSQSYWSTFYFSVSRIYTQIQFFSTREWSNEPPSSAFNDPFSCCVHFPEGTRADRPIRGRADH